MKNENLGSGKPPCLVAGCQRDTYGGSRGMCMNHYAVKQALVKKGRITWEQLENEGKAKPLLTGVESYSARSERAKRVKRTWSPTLKQFIFEKVGSTQTLTTSQE
jgi:hypothetical protein